jgi:hypothetical protein
MENKVENFKRISENRVSKILNGIDQLENLANTSYYEYTDEEINKIFDAIINEAKASRSKLLKNAKGKKGHRFEL